MPRPSKLTPARQRAIMAAIEQADRLDWLEQECEMHTTIRDWRALSCGIVPAERLPAMLEWVEAEQPDVWTALRETLHAIPAGVRIGDMTHAAVRAWAERIEQVYAEWGTRRRADRRHVP